MMTLLETRTVTLFGLIIPHTCTASDLVTTFMWSVDRAMYDIPLTKHIPRNVVLLISYTRYVWIHYMWWCMVKIFATHSRKFLQIPVPKISSKEGIFTFFQIRYFDKNWYLETLRFILETPRVMLVRTGCWLFSKKRWFYVSSFWGLYLLVEQKRSNAIYQSAIFAFDSGTREYVVFLTVLCIPWSWNWVHNAHNRKRQRQIRRRRRWRRG